MVSPTLTSVVADLAALTVRVAALEALATKNEKRISALEADMASHKAGAVDRQAHMDQLRSENDRIKWATRNGRQDIL